MIIVPRQDYFMGQFGKKITNFDKIDLISLVFA